jgi:hypothetical protein
LLKGDSGGFHDGCGEDKYMNQIANTPEPPYYAVVFTSVRTAIDEGCAEIIKKLGYPR